MVEHVERCPIIAAITTNDTFYFANDIAQGAAAASVGRCVAVAALQQYGGTVIRTSLSEEDTKKLQEALQPPTPTTAS